VSIVPDVGTVTEANAYAKLSEQLAAVARLNQSQGRPDLAPGRVYGAMPAGSLPEKLENWLKKLTENLRKITEHMPDVDSFSVQVGLPAGVSVSVTFRVEGS
jgi:hypothetical protein